MAYIWTFRKSIDLGGHIFLMHFDTKKDKI